MTIASQRCVAGVSGPITPSVSSARSDPKTHGRDRIKSHRPAFDSAGNCGLMITGSGGAAPWSHVYTVRPTNVGGQDPGSWRPVAGRPWSNQALELPRLGERTPCGRKACANDARGDPNRARSDRQVRQVLPSGCNRNAQRRGRDPQPFVRPGSPSRSGRARCRERTARLHRGPAAGRARLQGSLIPKWSQPSGRGTKRPKAR